MSEEKKRNEIINAPVYARELSFVIGTNTKMSIDTGSSYRIGTHRVARKCVMHILLPFAFFY